MEEEVAWYQTAEFRTLLVTALLTPVALWLISKGWILPEQKEWAIGLMNSAVLFVLGWVTTQFMKSRTEVAKVYAQARAALALNRAGVQGVTFHN